MKKKDSCQTVKSPNDTHHILVFHLIDHKRGRESKLKMFSGLYLLLSPSVFDVLVLVRQSSRAFLELPSFGCSSVLTSQSLLSRLSLTGISVCCLCSFASTSTSTEVFQGVSQTSQYRLLLSNSVYLQRLKQVCQLFLLSLFLLDTEIQTNYHSI